MERRVFLSSLLVFFAVGAQGGGGFGGGGGGFRGRPPPGFGPPGLRPGGPRPGFLGPPPGFGPGRRCFAPPLFANNKDLLSKFPDIIYFPLEDGQRCADVLRDEKIEGEIGHPFRDVCETAKPREAKRFCALSPRAYLMKSLEPNRAEGNNENDDDNNDDNANVPNLVPTPFRLPPHGPPPPFLQQQRKPKKLTEEDLRSIPRRLRNFGEMCAVCIGENKAPGGSGGAYPPPPPQPTGDN